MKLSRHWITLALSFSAVTAAEDMDFFALSIEQLLEIEVNSASGVTEQLIETPTPVSVVTEQMIRQSGVNTLRDLLTLYVPNFVQVQDQNEYNVAFRGVYTSAQQKFLVLLNGHRLNSRAYALASPDHAIALEKIKHIEILRGPGSSVHGNAALTSVVNIVTKRGGDLEGVKVAVEAGNHGYRELYAEAGSKKQGTDIFLWFKYAESNGEKWHISPEQDYSENPADGTVTAYLDGFFDEPSYDYGVLLSNDDDWELLANYRQSHYVEPLTTGGSSGAAYDIGQVPLIHGIGPGAQTEWFHSYLSKNWQVDEQNKFRFKVYYDTSKTTGVISNTNTGAVAFSSIAWQDKDLGFSSQWNYQVDQTTLLVGLDYDYMEVTDSESYYGNMNQIKGRITFNNNDLLPVGSEYIWSAYSQLKSQLNENWLLNAGIRYDHKNRHIGESITELSPRLALIRESDQQVVKLSYAKSFVDPPYWNRYSSLEAFRGAMDLRPEMLESYQISPEFYWLDKSLQVKLNLYYNQYSDVVFRRVTADREAALFTNAGEIDTLGLEQEISYHSDNKVLRFIGSQNRVVSSNHFPSSKDDIYNIPNYQFNLIFDHAVAENLEYQVSVKYIGKRLSPIEMALNGVPLVDPYPQSGVDFHDPNNELGSTVLVNAHVNWQLQSVPVTLSFNVQNLADKHWYQGGSVAHPYRQTGRWFKVGLEYVF